MYFFLFPVFLRESYIRSWAFPAFLAFSVWAQKLNQQPAVTYGIGKRYFVIKRNIKVNTSAAVGIFFVVLLFSFQNEWCSIFTTNISENTASI